jgi:hypothetical protein
MDNNTDRMVRVEFRPVGLLPVNKQQDNSCDKEDGYENFSVHEKTCNPVSQR